MNISERDMEVIEYFEKQCKTRSNVMPNLTNGRIVDGKLYCWDRDKKLFVHVELSPVTDVSLLNTIVAGLMEDKCEKTAEENGLESVTKD